MTKLVGKFTAKYMDADQSLLSCPLWTQPEEKDLPA